MLAQAASVAEPSLALAQASVAEPSVADLEPSVAEDASNQP
jgi:hypothetical protein